MRQRATQCVKKQKAEFQRRDLGRHLIICSHLADGTMPADLSPREAPIFPRHLLLEEIYLEDITCVRAMSKFEARRPDACVATDERTIVHGQAMRIG